MVFPGMIITAAGILVSAEKMEGEGGARVKLLRRLDLLWWRLLTGVGHF